MTWSRGIWCDYCITSARFLLCLCFVFASFYCGGEGWGRRGECGYTIVIGWVIKFGSDGRVQGCGVELWVTWTWGALVDLLYVLVSYWNSSSAGLGNLLYEYSVLFSRNDKGNWGVDCWLSCMEWCGRFDWEYVLGVTASPVPVPCDFDILSLLSSGPTILKDTLVNTSQLICFAE